MRITKAVITAAAPHQRHLPVQMLIDQEGVERSVLSTIVREAVRAGAEDVCVVVSPGDGDAYARVAGEDASRLHFVEQRAPLGYGDALFCARDFVGKDAFLHLLGDHVYVSSGARGGAEDLVALAASEDCTVSAVQVTRESLLPLYGAISGSRVSTAPGVYKVHTVVEKPTPTEAERSLRAPGLRSGYYLCFAGMHVFTPSLFERMAAERSRAGDPITLSAALAGLARSEKYLALIHSGMRFDVGVKYGFFHAQAALALLGKDRDRVLTQLVELLSLHAGAAAAGGRA